MEEIPGEEAFPAYLDSSIKTIYERAGLIELKDGGTGSLTMIGTVSPAGGNFEEPVTQATLGTVKTFLGLSSDRAYRRSYPAIDPLISWSRYFEQLRAWFAQHRGPGWVDDVGAMTELLRRGESINQMLQVTGEEGISLEDFVVWLKASMVDTVYLQQDAFDDVDASTSQERQGESFRLLGELIGGDYKFDSKEAAQEFFTRLTSLFRNWNYSAIDAPEFRKYRAEIQVLVGQVTP